ncbi:MAG: hypothetical protein FD159_2587 [Syntrophaceae bacterium]|nr:MAG: hypothetical protein FD159_2587 [Syntrophaceae bacterium]
MKTSRKWNFMSIAGKIMLGLVLITMIGSVGVAPALAKDKFDGRHDNRRYEKGPGYKRGHYVQPRPVYRSYGNYGHRERVYYPPPPVIYAPPPPPGIGIFFPPIFIRP